MSKIKKVLGFISGDLPNNKGENVHYTHLHVCYLKEGVTGLAVDIFKCVSDDVLEGVNPGDYVKAYFDENKKVQLLLKEEPSEQDLSEFDNALLDPLTSEAVALLAKQSDEQSEG